jgi:hypothetical protein
MHRRPVLRDSILWWELRRIPFNGLILLAGLFSFGVIELIGSRLVKRGDDVVEPMALIAGGAVYVIAANLCYTLGWITELLWSRDDASFAETMRPAIYRRGLMFSLVLTLSPAILVPLAWAVFGFK